MLRPSDEARANPALDRVFALGLEIWGDPDTVRVFLERPHPLLENAKPIDLLRSGAAGAQRVLDLLERGRNGSAA